MKTRIMNRLNEAIGMNPLFVAILVAILVVPLRALAEYGPTNRTDTWTDPGTGGWTSRYEEVELTNPGDVLNVRHGSQESPAFSADIVAGALPGSILPTNVSYRFRSGHVPPSAVRTIFHSARDGSTWHISHTPPPAGLQGLVDLPVDYGTGWIKGPGQTEDEFLDDLRHVDWIGVYIRRHGDIALQDSKIDDFTVRGMFYFNDDDMDGMENHWEDRFSLDRDDWRDASLNKDGDPMDNYAESRAGTDPENPNSFFTVEIDVTNQLSTARSVVLRWYSVPGRNYTVHRADTLHGEFTPLETGIGSTPYTNEWVGPNSTNIRSFFYRVEVE